MVSELLLYNSNQSSYSEDSSTLTVLFIARNSLINIFSVIPEEAICKIHSPVCGETPVEPSIFVDKKRKPIFPVFDIGGIVTTQ